MTLEKRNPAPLAGGNRAGNAVTSHAKTIISRRPQQIDFASINRFPRKLGRDIREARL